MRTVRGYDDGYETPNVAIVSMSSCPHERAPQRVDPSEALRISQQPDVLILDVRRPEAFSTDAYGLPNARALLLDTQAQQIPGIARDTPVLLYCLCSGEASSYRAALWMTNAGYRSVSVLRGGLPAWQAAGFEVSAIRRESARVDIAWIPAATSLPAGDALVARHVFLDENDRPTRRDIAVSFVDMVDSTGLLFRHPPERVLELIQRFMQIVVDTAMRHCGDVHDFAGDGAMLYFAGVGEALPAVFELRAALATARDEEPELPMARYAIAAGSVVAGHIGSTMSGTVAFIGPCVNAAARILPLADPDVIVATETVVRDAERIAPDLAETFMRHGEPEHLKGWDFPVQIYRSVRAGK